MGKNKMEKEKSHHLTTIYEERIIFKDTEAMKDVALVCFFNQSCCIDLSLFDQK